MEGERLLLTGCVALARGAIDAGCRYYFGYPITPQNDIPPSTSPRICPRWAGCSSRRRANLLHQYVDGCGCRRSKGYDFIFGSGDLPDAGRYLLYGRVRTSRCDRQYHPQRSRAGGGLHPPRATTSRPFMAAAMAITALLSLLPTLFRRCMIWRSRLSGLPIPISIRR